MSVVTGEIDTEILTENLRALFNYLQRVRKEIAALNQSPDGDDKFATMAQQLDGIVESTSDASDVIMEAVEKNGEAVMALREKISDAEEIAVLDLIENNNNTVFEACAFQDITGQRVAKIIKSVTYVESRIDALMEIWGRKELAMVELESDGELTDDEKLLHGPQAKAEAISQDEIDKLFD